MQEFVPNYYLWLKALHIISVISWMAAMLYMPRLFVYHTQVKVGSDQSELFKIMEYRLFRYICNPAMIATFIFGTLLIFFHPYPAIFDAGWIYAKGVFLFLLSGFHGMMSRWRKDFEVDKNTKSTKFFRIVNEVPALFMVIIVILAVVKPF